MYQELVNGGAVPVGHGLEDGQAEAGPHDRNQDETLREDTHKKVFFSGRTTKRGVKPPEPLRFYL